MFWKKNKYTTCKVYCNNREQKYSTETDKNGIYYEFTFKVVDPIVLDYKTIYLYDESANMYKLDQYYIGKLNNDTGEFIIKEEI